MLPLYQKLNKLLGVTAPRYGGTGYMLGNFVKLTVGTYFNSVPGIINSISLKPSFEAGWDINRDVMGNPISTTDTTYYVGQIPRMIEIDMTFTPIHDFTPQYPTLISNADKLDILKGSFINNIPTPKPPKTESPADTPDTIDEPAVSAASNTSTFGIPDPTLTQLQNSTDSSGNPVDFGANTPQ